MASAQPTAAAEGIVTTTEPQTEAAENSESELSAGAASPEATTEAPAAAEPAATGAPVVDEKEKEKELKAKWPGWPGYSVFRIVVPVLKVGSIIGRKGDLIRKIVEETRAKIRVLDGPVTSPDRIVLISGKEEPGAPLSPAMDAAIRIFKRLNGLSDGEAPDAAGAAFCLIRLIVASAQAMSLIGKQGNVIKSIQESSGASVRVLSNDEMPIYASSDEKIVEIQGEALKVLKGLEAVVGHLRKFLVDHSVLPLFEKNNNAPVTQERQVDAWSDKTLHSSSSQTAIDTDHPLPMKRDSLFLDRDSLMESHITPSRLSLYGPESGLDIRSSAMGRAGRPVVTQIAQTMQIPLAYAEDIIGVGGANIAYIRRTSGAILTVQESRGLPEEITVEIKGTSSQVQAAQQLIQEFTSGHKESLPSSYGQLDSSSRLSYSHLGSNSYSSSYARQPYGDYGSSGIGGYSGYRL
ncbi:RNA-binding KH domain-containing protein PEPPER [Abeliophyllum distichum]|uniref:RNA-binding KH domain-containing protein PEPPER n=1 Tax=Abeliophyllum distichum TaxID=126358 RepID=A0ABD1VAW7_9LAMI